MTQFYNRQSWFIFAPHLLWPLRNGADIYVVGIAKGISQYAANTKVTLIGANEIIVYDSGEQISQTKFQNKVRAKYHAVLLTLIKRSSYQKEKFITPLFIKKITSLNIPEQSNLVYSFNSALILSNYYKQSNYAHIVLTHNFDPGFFLEIAKASNNFIVKKVFEFTIKYTVKLLSENQNKFFFTHINETDLEKYKAMFQQMNHFILKAGVDDADADKILQIKSKTDSTIKLCFCGGLSSLQNFQALAFFSVKFWPALLHNYNSQISFLVIGSNPTAAVITLCKVNGWELLANLEDDQFNEIVSSCSFSVLPFDHTSGSKLKLLTCLARGTPFMATNIIKSQSDVVYPSSCLFSDEPQLWIKHLQHWYKLAKQSEAVLENLSFAQKFSWKNTCRSFIESLNENVAN